MCFSCPFFQESSCVQSLFRRGAWPALLVTFHQLLISFGGSGTPFLFVAMQMKTANAHMTTVTNF